MADGGAGGRVARLDGLGADDDRSAAPAAAAELTGIGATEQRDAAPVADLFGAAASPIPTGIRPQDATGEGTGREGAAREGAALPVADLALHSPQAGGGAGGAGPDGPVALFDGATLGADRADVTVAGMDALSRAARGGRRGRTRGDGDGTGAEEQSGRPARRGGSGNGRRRGRQQTGIGASAGERTSVREASAGDPGTATARAATGPAAAFAGAGAAATDAAASEGGATDVTDAAVTDAVGSTPAAGSDAVGYADADRPDSRARGGRGGAGATGRRGRGRRGPAELDPDADPVAAAREICLRLLSDRARTRQELAQALHRRGVPDDAAHAVLERFDEVGLIDDAAFAGQWVRSRHAHRGLARRAIAVELRRKGVSDDDAVEALAEVDAESEERRARELVDRKLRSLAIGTAEQRAAAGRRLVGMLARKGYGGGTAYRVVKEALAERGAEVDELGDAEPPDD